MTSEWVTESLRGVVGYIAKGIPPAYVENEGDTTIRVLNQKCNRDYTISYNESRLHDLSKKSVPQEKYLRDEDILINSTGTGTAGRVAQLLHVPYPTVVDGHMIVVRPNSKMIPLYLGYAIKAHQQKILKLDEGSTGQTELNRERLLSEIIVSYPVSLDTQKEIADTLSVIDARIVENKKINHHLEQMAQAIYAQTFSCDNSPTTPLGELIDVRDGTHDSPKAVEQGYPLVTSKHLLPYGVDLIAPNRISKADFDKINERSKVDRHDILISMIGTIGLISLVIEPDINFAIKNVGLFKTSQTEDLVYFLLCFLRSPEITNHIDMRLAGSTQKYISLGELRQLPVVVPSADVLQDFNDSVKPLFEEITLRTEETKRLATLRDTLLPRLMSGELSVAELGDTK